MSIPVIPDALHKLLIYLGIGLIIFGYYNSDKINKISSDESYDLIGRQKIVKQKMDPRKTRKQIHYCKLLLAPKC